MIKAFALASALTILLTSTVSATSFRPKQWSDLVSEADQIFVGTVTGITSQTLSNGGVVNDVTFGSVSVVKGTATNTVTLRMLVGVLNRRIHDLPTFSVGTTYVAFVTGNGQVIVPIVGGPQGLFVVRSVAGQSLVYDSRGQALPNGPIALPTFLDTIRAGLPQ